MKCESGLPVTGYIWPCDSSYNLLPKSQHIWCLILTFNYSYDLTRFFRFFWWRQQSGFVTRDAWLPNVGTLPALDDYSGVRHVDQVIQISSYFLPPPWPYNADGVPTPFERSTGDGEEHFVIIAHPGPCPDFWSCYCLSFICSRELRKYYPWIVCLLFLYVSAEFDFGAFIVSDPWFN